MFPKAYDGTGRREAQKSRCRKSYRQQFNVDEPWWRMVTRADFPDDILSFAEAFAAAGGRAIIVGGVVRDPRLEFERRERRRDRRDLPFEDRSLR